MQKRQLGNSGIEVSALGMGCWAIGGPWQFRDSQGGWGETDDNESIRAVHQALDNGINFFDTAANYGAGHSERILGQALAGKRDQAVIATKFGYNVDEAGKSVGEYQDAVEKYIRADCETSLRRLNIDTIDLYQFHVNAYPAEKAAPVRDLLEDLVREGKIRAYGWSTDFVGSARVFAEGEHCVAIQHDLNLVKDAPEMLTFCEAANLASINRTPLSRGALTGKYTRTSQFAENDVRHSEGSTQNVHLPALDALDHVRDVLTSGGRTLTQGALAWIWARSEQTVPIPGIRTVAQADENAKALDFGPLNADEMRQIDELLNRAPVL